MKTILRVIISVVILLNVANAEASPSYKDLAQEKGFKGISNSSVSDIALGIKQGTINANHQGLKDWLYPNSKDLFRVISVSGDYVIYSDILPEPVHNYIAVKRLPGEIYTNGMWLTRNKAGVYYSLIGTYTYITTMGSSMTVLAFEKHILDNTKKSDTNIYKVAQVTGIQSDRLKTLIKANEVCGISSHDSLTFLNEYTKPAAKANILKTLNNADMNYKMADLSSAEKVNKAMMTMVFKNHPNIACKTEYEKIMQGGT